MHEPSTAFWPGIVRSTETSESRVSFPTVLQGLPHVSALFFSPPHPALHPNVFSPSFTVVYTSHPDAAGLTSLSLAGTTTNRPIQPVTCLNTGLLDDRATKIAAERFIIAPKPAAYPVQVRSLRRRPRSTPLSAAGDQRLDSLPYTIDIRSLLLSSPSSLLSLVFSRPSSSSFLLSLFHHHSHHRSLYPLLSPSLCSFTTFVREFASFAAFLRANTRSSAAFSDFPAFPLSKEFFTRRIPFKFPLNSSLSLEANMLRNNNSAGPATSSPRSSDEAASGNGSPATKLTVYSPEEARMRPFTETANGNGAAPGTAGEPVPRFATT